ncbi:hypothetical protein GCM10010992_10680 [Cloacibacterium rupense]|uniref:YdhG-like domain-containing protein n=1 Tax=Cloacibacterium rupense TaxID=517423 RepID=A0ABQ2NIN1_9FLAO|nr:DUF1801 domain-containing protein [Cloacibacterium rupense]GGP03206.1 hypothetical protein GCM10010992_10680 [Cloacibacterium rupense]
MNPIQEYFLNQPEPARSLLLFLREQILSSDQDITETFSFGLPFYKYKGKMLCYFSFHKKFKKYYISFNHGNKIESPFLIQEDRKLFKILLIDENEDFPLELLLEILDKVKKWIK